MARKSAASTFLEDVLPHAVSGSIAKRMQAKRKGAMQPGKIEPEHEDPLHDAEAPDAQHGPDLHADESEYGAPANQNEAPGIGAAEDASPRPRQRMPSESRDRAAAARMGGNMGQHPGFPAESANPDVHGEMAEESAERPGESETHPHKNHYAPRQGGKRGY